MVFGVFWGWVVKLAKLETLKGITNARMGRWKAAYHAYTRSFALSKRLCLEWFERGILHVVNRFIKRCASFVFAKLEMYIREEGIQNRTWSVVVFGGGVLGSYE